MPMSSLSILLCIWHKHSSLLWRRWKEMFSWLQKQDIQNKILSRELLVEGPNDYDGVLKPRSYPHYHYYLIHFCKICLPSACLPVCLSACLHVCMSAACLPACLSDNYLCYLLDKCLLDKCLLDKCLLDKCLLDKCLLDKCLLNKCLLEKVCRTNACWKNVC